MDPEAEARTSPSADCRIVDSPAARSSDEVAERETGPSLVQAAARALRVLIAALHGRYPSSEQMFYQWWSSTELELGLALRDQTLPLYDTAMAVLMHAERLALEAEKIGAATDVVRQAAVKVTLCYSLLRSSQQFPAANILSAAAVALNDIGIKAPRNRLQTLRRSALRVPLDADWRSAIGVSKEALDAHLRAIRVALRDGDLPRVLPEIASERRASTTEDLAELVKASAGGRAFPAAGVLAYDRSESAIKVIAVEASGFRGIPSTLRLQCARDERPGSALLIGDNGTGKSSIADAIEYALQGRIARSSDLTSSLAPMLPTLAADASPVASVHLSDGTVMSRGVIFRDGKLLPATFDVRAGFRLAPVTLRRSDILRFLDTGSLSRGTVFFDYFPDPTQQLARRPDDATHELDERAFAARVRRSALSSRLATLLGEPAEEIADSTSFKKILQTHVTGNRAMDVFERQQGWSEVDPNLSNAIFDLLRCQQEIAAIRKERATLGDILNPIRFASHAARLRQILVRVGEEVTAAFKQVARADHVDRIDVFFGESGPVSLDIVVKLINGKLCFPQQIFSEGYRDLLAFLFFLAIAGVAAEYGQARVLVLDDVFQSIDASVRADAMRYLLQKYSNWQFVVTVHDRLWAEQLRGLFRAARHDYIEHHITAWTFRNGPLVETSRGGVPDLIRRLGTQPTPSEICGAAGRLLELAGNQLSWRLGISVRRRFGDKYALGDLWPGIVKSVRSTELAPVTRRLEAGRDLRNIAGSHYNEWSEGLSLTEARAFADDVREFVGAAFCEDCSDWIAGDGRLECRCGKKRYERRSANPD